MQGYRNTMSKDINYWYTSWFNTPYYHILYKNRDHKEAANFMNKLTSHLKLEKKDRILDLACGRGRHAKYLYRKGFDVTGVDLSEESIAYAKEYERDRLHFVRHNMLEPYPDTFDAVFNLFTSFGYFEQESDNLRTIKSIKNSLKPNGHGVIDFLNSKLAIENLVPEETKVMGGITFHIEKYVEDGFIFKNIRFRDEGEDYLFTERIMALTIENFELYFEKADVKLKDVFGDYYLNEFDEDTSDRLILLFRR